MKYPIPKALEDCMLPNAETAAIQNASAGLVQWINTTLATLRAAGVKQEARGPMLVELMIYGAVAAVIGYDDVNALPLDADGFADFSASCFATATRELAGKRTRQ